MKKRETILKVLVVLVVIAFLIIVLWVFTAPAASYADWEYVPPENTEDNYVDLVTEWLIYYNTDVELGLCLVQHESGFNPSAQNKYSTAGGLYQFLDGTWLYTIDKMGVDWTLEDKMNPQKNAQAGAWLLANEGYTHWVVWKNCVSSSAYLW